jgi:hypothetical protein
MLDLVIHPKTSERLEDFLANPAHAILLSAPVGSGKAAISHYLAMRLLGLQTDDFSNQPYIRLIRSDDGKAIGIDTIRELEHFLSLKVPGERQIDRVVIVEDAHLLTTEAQNALLKTLEEPPAATVLIMTTEQDQALLPTVRSRMQAVALVRPTKLQLQEHFQQLGHAEQAISQTYTVSGGLPGLMQSLLTDSEHPLNEATIYARQLLQLSRYERLTLVDMLAKQRRLAQDTCFILQQMAHVSLQTTTTAASDRWKYVLSSSYEASEQLAGNAQPKLVLINLMLKLS